MMSDSKNDERIIKVLGFLQMLYPNFETNEAMIAAYLRILDDVPAELIEQAAEDLGSTSTFFPAAAELRKAAFGLVERAQGNPSSFEAWGQVRTALNGNHSNIHPLARQAIDSLGGLAAFGQSNMNDETSWRARFIQSYEILLNRQRRDLAMLPGVRQFADELAAGRVNGEIKELAARLGSSKFEIGNSKGED